MYTMITLESAQGMLFKVVRDKEMNLKEDICNLLNIDSDSVYIIHNGKLLNSQTMCNGLIHIVPRVVGGKGGFGSMLRAIGAQIEKTTNREACRDLSGRRLRDINEEKRLKTFINQQAEREKEAQDRKRKKLEKLCEMPKSDFVDETYDKERSDLQEKIEDAVVKGLEVAGEKRKGGAVEVVKKKKLKLWVDADLEDSLSDSDDQLEEDSKKCNANVESLVCEAKSSC